MVRGTRRSLFLSGWHNGLSGTRSRNEYCEDVTHFPGFMDGMEVFKELIYCVLKIFLSQIILQRLDLSNNNLTKIDNLFDDLLNLEYLNLSSN